MDPAPGPALPLRGWYVISPRPVGEHATLRRASAARGAHLLAISPLRLVGLPDSDADLAKALAAPVAIFTSPAAVRFAAEHGKLRKPSGSHWCAVGAGTAAALRRAGVDGVLHPHRRMDSEGLMALAPLQSINGLEVGVITAPGGRGLVLEQLRERGARTIRADVYRREPIRIAPRRLMALDNLPPQTAFCISSAEALGALWQQLSQARRERLQKVLAIVSSARLARLARQNGFETLRRADSAQPEAMIRALAEAAAGPLFR